MKNYRITDLEIQKLRDLARLENDMEINKLLDKVITRGSKEYADKYT